MRARQIKTVLEKAIEKPKETPPVFLEGPPGVGKSSVPYQVAMEHKIEWLDMRLAQRDPTDLRGIPAVIDGQARWLAPPELPKDPKSRGILMLDELSSCPPLTQAAAYQLTLDRKISEYQLPDGWYIVAAGNRLEDRAVVYRMSSALANRFWWIEFEVSVDDWVEWAMNHGIDVNIISYIHWRGMELLAPKFNPESSEKAFATPRTWEYASRLTKILPKNLLHSALEGTVGKGATADFMAFLKVQTELPDLNDILVKEENFVPKRIDLRYALVGALASRAKGEKQFERLIRYSEYLPGEFAVLLVTLLQHKDEGTMMLAPSFTKWAKEHSDIILPGKMKF